MKFVMSYSGGKDSAFALYRMLQKGHQCVGLLVMMNTDMERSWFHGIAIELLEEIAEALELPLYPCYSKGDTYHLQMENLLKDLQGQGVEACVFGDIDIEEHRTWCEARCNQVGMQAIFPLWQENRRKIVEESIALGFVSIIKCIQHTQLPTSLLGKALDMRMLDVFDQSGIDVCGEAGEYHTVSIDGPCFKHCVDIELKDQLSFGTRTVIDIRKRV